MKISQNLLLLLITASIFFIPATSFLNIKHSKIAPVTMQTQGAPCPHHSSTSASCSTSSSLFWLQAESDLLSKGIPLVLTGVLFFIFCFSFYNSPTSELFRPPIGH